MIGWIVGWPNRDKADRKDEMLDFCGSGTIVAVCGDHLIVRMSDEGLVEGEPSYCLALCLHDEALRYFQTEAEYHAWLAFWRRSDEADHLHDVKPQGRA